MQRDTFENIVALTQRVRAESTEIATCLALALLAAAILAGFLLACRIFRGGLPRSGSTTTMRKQLPW